MEDKPTTPVFADRYRFELVGSDWDRGRGGFTGLVYDLKEKRLGVIKRTETSSRQLTYSLQNEIRALNALKGLGVPELYDTGQAVHDSKQYDYVVLEYIDGVRVEKNLASLSIVECAKIITQLFGVLFQAHKRGIINGDIDLKHLFWRKEKEQLVVIDWGNARLGVDRKKNTEFAYDLARAAEVIFSLVTTHGHPPATGSIALPDKAALRPNLTPLPVEFLMLCNWAPRIPSDGTQSPYTTKELFETSKKWLEAISNSKPYKQNLPKRVSRFGIAMGLFPVIVFIVALTIFSTKISYSPPASLLPTLITIPTESLDVNTQMPTVSLTSTAIPFEITLRPTETPQPLNSPLNYYPIVVFDDADLPSGSEYKLCWTNRIIPLSELVNPEGFYRKVDDNKWWIFKTGDRRTNRESVMTDFSTCPNGQSDGVISLSKSVKALALNAWVTQLRPGRVDTPEGEFGFFLSAADGFIREYTLWIDGSNNLNLRIRESTGDPYDEKIVIANVQNSGYGNAYRQFRVQIFLEMDNNGSSIIYLLEAPSDSVEARDIDPSRMIRIDTMVRPTMENIEGFGLVGRGSSTQVLIWPLALLGK